MFLRQPCAVKMRTHRVVAQLGEDALHGLLVLLALIAAFVRLDEQPMQLGIAEVHIAAMRIDRLQQILRVSSRAGSGTHTFIAPPGQCLAGCDERQGKSVTCGGGTTTATMANDQRTRQDAPGVNKIKSAIRQTRRLLGRVRWR